MRTIDIIEDGLPADGQVVVGRCKPFRMNDVTEDSCQRRKAYASKSMNKDVKACRKCKGLVNLKKKQL